MPRDAHSASSVGLGARCRRAWYYRYVQRLRPPDVTWAQIEAGANADPGARSRALGTAMHAVLERYYGHGQDDPRAVGAGTPGAPNWDWYPGQVALGGVDLLPRPEACQTVIVESQAVVTEHGIRWMTVPDLVVLPTADESRRLGHSPGWLLHDHKSSKDPARWALSPARLLADVQANLYALRVCREWSLRAVQCRWVYFDTTPAVGTRGAPVAARGRALPVDITIARVDAVERLRKPAALCHELDAITTIEQAPLNTAACRDYGGCPYHASRGGPCTAQRSLAAFVDARRVRNNQMDKEDLKAKFAKHQAATASATPPAAAAEAAAPKPKRRARKADAADPPPAPAPAVAPAGGVAARLQELVADLAETEATIEAATAHVAEVRAEIHSLTAG